MDDLGWFCGKDDSGAGGPSRTGMPRPHGALDYIAVNELGKRLNMKISCAFVLGEWDPDNRLAKIPYLSKFGDNWNNAAYINITEARKCAEVINASEYIDINIHGLLHGYYLEGVDIDNYDKSDYAYTEKGVFHKIIDDEIRAKLDAFLDLIKYYGINKTIDSFIPPSFLYHPYVFSYILKDYGIKYISTIFKNFDYKSPCGKPFNSPADVENGIITVDRNNNPIPWNEYASDPRALPVITGVFGCHFPNILHIDPRRNYEVVDRWVEYFEKCAEEFGVILSEDMNFLATQSLFLSFANVEKREDGLAIDISAVPEATGKSNCFYISAHKPIKSYTGCDIELYKTHSAFINYKVTPKANFMLFK